MQSAAYLPGEIPITLLKDFEKEARLSYLKISPACVGDIPPSLIRDAARSIFLYLIYSLKIIPVLFLNKWDRYV